MRIIVLSSQVFAIGGTQALYGYGGLEVIAWLTAKGLAEKGHKVTLIAPMGSTCPGVSVFETLPPGGFSEEQVYRGCMVKNTNGQDVHWKGYWPKLLECNPGKDSKEGKSECGVIIDHSWNKWPLMLKAEEALRCPVLNVLHAPVNTMFGSLPPVDKPCFVCISNDQRRHFESLFSPAQARTCWNGIDLDFYKPLGIKRSDRYLFLARFSSIKGALIAIEACKEAGVGLDLVGDTQVTGEPGYLEQCQKQADGKQIRIIGNVSRSETIWWYSQARAFLHPNKIFREPFGLAPLEAQACGLPVLAWKYGAMKETVLHDTTGYLVDSKEQMVDLLRTNALDKLSRQKCQDWAGEFSIKNMVSRYEELCQEALASGGW